jgi:uncharacterized protein YcbX
MRLTGLWAYPIKSCRGVALTKAEVVARGLEHDRRYMVVDAQGRFLSQRKLPRMTMVHTAIDGDEVFITHKGVYDLRLPLSLRDGKRRPATVWGDEVETFEHEAGGRFFRQVLGVDCALVYLPDDVSRPVGPKHGRPGEQLAFADAYPFLIISEASLDALNARLERPVEMARFRPNLVIDGVEAHGEDQMARLRVGQRTFRATKRCDRCTIPTVDLETGKR